MKILKLIAIILILTIGAFSIVVLSIGTIRSQIMEIAGLAVAQTPLQWNRVKDAASGASGLTSGILVSGMYAYTGAGWNGLIVDANGQLIAGPRIASTFVVNQVLVSGSVNMIRVANAARLSILIRNTGVIDMFIGASNNVAASNGMLIRPNEVARLDRNTSIIYGVTAGASTNASYLEE